MTRFAWIMAVALAGLSTACQTVDRTYEWDYGRAFHTVFENQKLDPNAGDGSPVTGQSGTVAAAAYTRYEQAKPESKEKPAPTILQFSKSH